MADELLLTDKEKTKLYKAYLNEPINDARGLINTTSEAQLAKAKPIIEKAEREKIANHLELLLKHSPLRSVSLRRESGNYTHTLKEGK